MNNNFKQWDFICYFSSDGNKFYGIICSVDLLNILWDDGLFTKHDNMPQYVGKYVGKGQPFNIEKALERNFTEEYNKLKVDNLSYVEILNWMKQNEHNTTVS